jgi:NADH-quinone oxidoreductase subunit C
MPTTSVEVLNALAAEFGVQVVTEGVQPHAVVPADDLVRVCYTLRNDARWQFGLLNDVCGTDWLEPDAKKLTKAGFEPHLELVYQVSSIAQPGLRLMLKVFLPRIGASVPSVSEVWPTANWHEREAYDMLGILFTGHPNLVRLLLADDWVGHPLRKDYEFPLEYRGIRCR